MPPFIFGLEAFEDYDLGENVEHRDPVIMPDGS